MQWRMVGIAWLLLVLSACSSVQQNNSKPIFGKRVYHYYQWEDYCKRFPKDVDCKE